MPLKRTFRLIEFFLNCVLIFCIFGCIQNGDRALPHTVITLSSGQQLCYTIRLAESIQMRRSDKVLLFGNARSLRTVTTQLRTTDSALNKSSTDSISNTLCLQWLHAKPTIILALELSFYVFKRRKAFIQL